jgi:CBS domain-containing protein
MTAKYAPESLAAMDLVASEVMRRRVQTVSVGMSLPVLERAFVRAGVSGFPVVDGDRLVGVISRSNIIEQMDLEHQTAQRTSDFYRDANGFHEVPVVIGDQVADRVGERLEQLTVQDAMHRQLFAVAPDQPLRAVAQTMVDNEIHRVLVTHEGRLLGIISTSDFVRLYAQGRIKSV